jgi:phosphoglycerate dehydrogenase-like enzyme
LGFGYIGEKVVRMALGFGMKVTAWSKNMTSERAEAAGAEAATLDECLQADFVSLHLHVTDETRGIISRERIGQLKPGA